MEKRYDLDEDMRWLASKVVSDDHYGAAVSESELEYRKNLEEEYKNEIGLAKLMLAENPRFNELSLEDKINLSGNLILELAEKNKGVSRK